MNADRLLELYDRIAEAPDAIARLRRFVLDLAVRGKLVEQDAGDEPASELLKRIMAEKARLVKAGEIRKPKPSPDVSMDEQNFPSPLGWAWSRLGGLALITQGFAFSSGDYSREESAGPPLIKIGDIGSNSPEVFIKGAFDESYLVKPGELLLGLSGSIKCARWEGPVALLNQRIARILPTTTDLTDGWLLLAVDRCLDKWKSETSKLTVQNIKAKQLFEAPVPLPPLAEQNRIVAKVDELMALLDRLEATRTAREATRDRLTAASLSRLTAPDTDAEAFPAHANFALDALPALTARPDQIKQLRQTILNFAVRGKLVEQDPADETASELLKRIAQRRKALAAEEGVRKKKPVAPLADEDELGLPENWAADAFANLIDPRATISYGVLVPGPDVEGGIPFVRAQDLTLADHPERPSKTIAPEVEAKYARTRLSGGEILLCVVGSIGKLGVAPPHWAGANIARAVARISPVDLLDRNYLLLFLRSDRAQGYFEEATRTLAQPTLNVGLIEKLPVPLPPLAEQHRIVAKVDALMALCDRLEAALATADTTRQRLLEALLHETLTPCEEQEAAA